MPDQITQLLDQIDRLDRDASPSPWQNDGYDVLGAPYELREMLLAPHVASADQNESDAEFIALARTALPAMSKALRAVLAKCASMERGVGYRVSGQHDTWDSYHEGMSDMAGYIEETITDTLEGAD